MSVYFHANFKLANDKLAGILDLLIKIPELSDDQIAERFGYKAPFTKRYKSWLKKCGILEDSTKTNLTDYGQIIYKLDPKLKKDVTLWYMHSHLTSGEDISESWNFFYHNFLPKTSRFSKSELTESISMKLMPHDAKHFGKNAPMIKVITKVLIDSYISDLAFGPLNIVEMNGGVYFRKDIKCPFKWNSCESFKNLY
jgi:hypothetical protein